MFTPSGCKDIGIRKFELVAKTQFRSITCGPHCKLDRPPNNSSFDFKHKYETDKFIRLYIRNPSQY